jgi:hypothetical protein
MYGFGGMVLFSNRGGFSPEIPTRTDCGAPLAGKKRRLETLGAPEHSAVGGRVPPTIRWVSRSSERA